MYLRFLRLALQRISQSQLRGPKRVIINYWWLPSLWKSGGRRHQMCGRGRGAKGLSLPSQKQCSNLAVMHFCLIDCFDAVFFPILFLRGHWCPLLSSLDEENLVGFQLHPARTFRRFFDGKKSHWRPQGPQWPLFMYQHHNTPFLIPDKKWVRRKSNVWKAYSVCKWTYVPYGVCVCRVVLFVYVRLQWKGEARDPQTTWGVS